jgi:hypothetical protein
MKFVDPKDGHLRLKHLPAILVKLAARVIHNFPHVRSEETHTSRKSEPGYREDTDSGKLGPRQKAIEGVGPIFQRKYRLEFKSKYSAQEIMAAVQKNPDRFAPDAFAKYKKVKGKAGVLKEGDEFFIEMTGPWNGPVRVLEVKPRSFVLGTLDGHMEAGQIHFRVRREGRKITFEIESLARSRDEGVDLAYDKFKVAQFVQTEMWNEFLENIAKFAGDPHPGKIQVEVVRFEVD